MAVASGASDTKLLLKKMVPTRMLINDFARAVEEAEQRGADRDELSAMLGKGRSRAGIFEGDREQGEIEIGMCSALVGDIPEAGAVVRAMMKDCRAAIQGLSNC
jgi:enoyl-[acyl-carrier protein] reductase II